MTKVFILAHQDDEVFILPRIMHEIACHNSVHCIFLTAGGIIRCRESRNLLTSIGLKSENISFLGDELGISDGLLMEHLETAYYSLIRNRAVNNSTTIFVPAWEGGHHDHDACAYIVSVLKARFLEKNTAVFQFYLYNGEGLCWKFFKVMTPLLSCKSVLDYRSFTFSTGMTALLAMRYYPSQLLTWIGLAPGMFVKFLFNRSEALAPLTQDLTASRPHAGRLLYERYGRTTYENLSFRCLSFLSRIDGTFAFCVGRGEKMGDS